MSDNYEKIDDNTLRVTSIEEVASDVSYDALLASRERHAQAKADAIAYYDKCIAALDVQIAQAENLGLKTQETIAVEAAAAERARVAALGETP